MKPLLFSIRFPVLIALAIAFVGCSSAHKRAQEMLEQGLYENAIEGFERILREKPGDPEALAGLNQARFGFIGQKLIEVRRARLAGSDTQSLDVFLNILEKQKEWGMVPGGPAAFTQVEERAYAMDNAAQRVQKDLAQSQPLRAEYFLVKYEPIFSGEQRPKYDALKKQVRANGQASCRAFQKEKLEGRPNLAQFLSTYCQYWGEKSRKFPEDARAQLSIFFREPSIEVEIERMPLDAKALLSQQLQRVFESTAWFDPHGKKRFSAKVTGSFTNDHRRERLSLAHVYSTHEPYKELVRKKQMREVPYTAIENVYDAASGTTRPQSVTRTRAEEYWVDEEETRYREVSRTHYYPAWKVTQKLELHLVSEIRLDEYKSPFSLSETSDMGGIEHHENQPSIGLKPSKPELRDVSAWIKTQNQRFASSFETALIQRWRDVHCNPSTESPSFAVTGEQVALCLRQKLQDPPAFAQNWYQKHFGVSVQEASWVLERK